MKKNNNITDHYRKIQEFKQTEADEVWGGFQTLNTKLLVNAAKGELNLNAWAKIELANRGLNSDGQWIGFYDANKHFKLNN